MSELRVAYIRPMKRYPERYQRKIVERFAPDRVLDRDLEAVRNFMRRSGRVLIVPQLATLDRKRAVVAEVVRHVLSHGCTIIEAKHDRRITPECIDAVMAGMEAPRHDVDRRKQAASGKIGGARTKWTAEQLNETLEIWQSRELTYKNAKELTREILPPNGGSYSLLARWWTDRPVPVKRGVGAGRR